MAETKIEPALSVEQWESLKRPTERGVSPSVHTASGYEVSFMGDSLHVRDWASMDGIFVRLEAIPELVALLNDALPDSDHRKITRHRIALLRYIVGRAPGADDVDKVDSALANDFLDALESYLPPE